MSERTEKKATGPYTSNLTIFNVFFDEYLDNSNSFRFTFKATVSMRPSKNGT